MRPESILHFAPNIPVTLALVDPEGQWDSEMRQGTYQTTAGQTFVLPRAAVVQLNMLEPKPGEEIQITKVWKGRRTDPVTWTICLSARSEQARAREEAHTEAQEPSELTEALQASIDRVEATKRITEPPTIVRKPSRKPVEPQPRLFDRGTGTDGPALAPARPRPHVIPWNVAFREVSAFVAKELEGNRLQWSDSSQQDLVSTVLIAEVKAGRIGPWERPE